MTSDKSNLLADRLLAVLTEQKKAQITAARHLVDHLIAKGNKSVHMEHHLDKTMDERMEQESKEMAESGDGMDPEANEGVKDELKKITNAFFEIYEEFDKFAPDGTDLKEDSALYKELALLRDRLTAEDADLSPDDMEDKIKELDVKLKTIGLSVPADYPRWASSPIDFLEVLLSIPKLPRAELQALHKAFDDGSKDAYLIVAQLRKWESSMRLPKAWLETSVDKDEDDEEDDDGQAGGEDEAGYEYADGDYEPGAGAADYEVGEVEKRDAKGSLRGSANV